MRRRAAVARGVGFVSTKQRLFWRWGVAYRWTACARDCSLRHPSLRPRTRMETAPRHPATLAAAACTRALPQTHTLKLAVVNLA